PGDAVIGINVAPSFRGQGLGSKALDAVNEVASTHKYQRIVALIRPDNIASLKAFERAGYSFATYRSINGISAHCFIRSLN
ncbi:MAG TPA: N-acetyltransferase, partial [Myxococcales bacterium]|nr:N-acetyltransferase [Myxococcales bacterium]